MARPAVADEVHRWGVYEATLESAADHPGSLHDATVSVEVTGPGGARRLREAFWDGGRTWRLRICPDCPGRWKWRTACRQDAGLDARAGSFDCVAYTGDNPLYAHGPVRVADDGRHLAHADGTPWFWLADTAWNGALRGRDADWDKYLEDRCSKGFTAVQFVSTQWRAARGDRDGRKAYLGKGTIDVDPAFFRRMDERLRAVVERGLVPAPVMFWALHVNPEMSPAASLSTDQLVALGRYMLARWGAYPVVWFLGGDGDYRGRKAARWREIGRTLFGESPDRPVTMHPMGQTWVGDEFRTEPWLAFHGYQSGHGDSDEHLRWQVEGPPAAEWGKRPVRPVINLEPNYEGHVGYQHRTVHDAHAVRRALWWSLLVHPPAGVTYGHHGIWAWQDEAKPPLNHPHSGVAPPWHEAMKAPGSEGVKHLKAFFAGLQWWRLRPAPELLAEQPGATDVRRFIAAARADDGSFAVVYTPEPGAIALKADAVPSDGKARWFDPRTGRRSDAKPTHEARATFQTLGPGDWALWLGR